MTIHHYQHVFPKDTPLPSSRNFILGRHYSLLVCTLGFKSLNTRSLPNDGPQSQLHKIILHTKRSCRFLRAVPLGRLLYQGKSTYWIVFLDDSASIYALRGDHVDDDEDDLYMPGSYDEEEHVCTWLQKPFEPDFGNKEIVFVKFGHIDSLRTQGPGLDSIPIPVFEVQRWECRLWVEDDEPKTTKKLGSYDDRKNSSRRRW